MNPVPNLGRSGHLEVATLGLGQNFSKKVGTVEVTRLWGHDQFHRTSIEPLGQTQVPKFRGIFATIDPLSPPQAQQLHRDSKLFLPEHVPLYLVHGTWQTPEHLDNWYEAFDPQKRFIYRACLPEIKEATGIAFPEDHSTPSLIVSLQDLGQFRIQLLAHGLEGLKNHLDPLTALPTNVRARQLASYFGIAPGYQKKFGQVLESTLLPLLFQPGRITGYKQTSLYQEAMAWQHTIQGVAKRVQAASKTSTTQGDAQNSVLPDIIDGQWFWSMSHHIPEQSNLILDWSIPEKHDELINAPTTKSDGATKQPIFVRVFNGEAQYKISNAFRHIENTLYDNFLKVLREDKASNRDPSFMDNLARQCARQITNQLYPSAAGLGYSIGGTALVSAFTEHLRYFQDGENGILPTVLPFKDYLWGGDGLGMVVTVCSPLTGIPEKPAWSQKLLDKINSRLHPLLTHPVWGMLEKNRPGVTEAKANSILMQRLQQGLETLPSARHSVIAVQNLNDPFIEEKASGLPQSVLTHPNLINIPIRVPRAPAPSMDTLNQTYVMPFLKGFDIKRFPNLANRLYHLYLDYFSSQLQHQTILKHPEYVMSQPLFETVLRNPDNLLALLNLSQFAPLRRRVLLALTTGIQGQLAKTQTSSEDLEKKWNPLSKWFSPRSVPEDAIASLASFLVQRNDLLPLILANATEDIIFSESAAHEALKLMSAWSDSVQWLVKNATHLPQQESAILESQLAILKGILESKELPSSKKTTTAPTIYTAVRMVQQGGLTGGPQGISILREQLTDKLFLKLRQKREKGLNTSTP